MTIFDAMPGLEMPIPLVTQMLTSMSQTHLWGSGGGASLFRASQMNLVLHQGSRRTPEEALEAFDTAVKFSQRYPCRVVVLCPEPSSEKDLPLRGKLFSVCYVGESLRDECYCEALILGYTTKQAQFVGSQTSLWVENDLPTHYWLNGVSEPSVRKYYVSLSEIADRIIYDSAVSDYDIHTIPWPEGKPLQDLADTRLTQIKQTLGHFLSTYPPQILIGGLSEVTIQHPSDRKPEAKQFMRWIRACLEACAEIMKSQLHTQFSLEESDSPLIHMTWKYADEKSLTFEYNEVTSHAKIDANYYNTPRIYPAQLKPLEKEDALAIAIFND